MSHGKQFTLFSHIVGPNGWKVAFVLAELGLSYEPKYLDLNKGDQKSPEYTQYNPNGRIPTLVDHSNNDFTIWESNAIIVYLVERYDTERRISVADADEQAQQLQWLFFQASGQAPYYGQAGWFINRHPEKIPSAIERYVNEILRVLGVLDGVLAKREWLVAGRCTIADISLIPWNSAIFELFKDGDHKIDVERDFPAVARWHNAVISRQAIAEQIALRKSLL